MNKLPISVYGATGHTGRLVAAELVARGQDVVLAGRDAGALDALARDLGGSTQVRVAELDDHAALRKAAERSVVLINCAGPFSHSGEPVVSAALAAGCHYLDHAAEPRHVKHLFDAFQERARAANTVVIPGMSFYGALADLLADLLGKGARQDTVTVAYAIGGWRLTTASKATAAQLIGADRVLYTDGAHRVAPARSTPASFEFPPPVGVRSVVADYPAGEVVTIPRHVATRAVRVLMTTDTFTEETAFTSEDVDAATRARSSFTVAVHTGADRRGHLSGQDIYRAGAVVSVQAALALADASAPPAGVLSAAEAFPAEPFLRELERRGLFTMQLHTKAPVS